MPGRDAAASGDAAADRRTVLLAALGTLVSAVVLVTAVLVALRGFPATEPAPPPNGTEFVPSPSPGVPDLVVASCDAPSEGFVTLCEAYLFLHRDFVDPLEDADLAAGAVVGIEEHVAFTNPAGTAAVHATPPFETVTCTAPSDDFVAMCEAYAVAAAQLGVDLPDTELVRAAIRGMVDHGVGDPFTAYLTPERAQAAREERENRVFGIGAFVAMRHLHDPERTEACRVVDENCGVVVIAPIPGSPAEAAGLEPGDVIAAVDATPVAGMTIDDVVNLVRGDPGTDVTLLLRRGEETYEATIRRQQVTIPQVTAEVVDDGVVHVQLFGFRTDSPAAVREALADALAEGVAGIVLDLRNNPGGGLFEVIEIASEFLPPGEVVLIEQFAGGEEQELEAVEGGIATDPSIGLVVLVNGGSASGSEVLAGALQDHGRAIVVGEPTFGKNTVQHARELSDGSGLRITIARWLTPDRRSSEGVGIAPDVLVETPEQASDEDPFLAEALRILRER